MKQIRLISLCLLLCTVFASLKAQVNTQFDGDYSGTAYNIKMKGELKPSQKMVFRLHNGVLTGAVPKIGKMPGTILFSIKNLSSTVKKWEDIANDLWVSQFWLFDHSGEKPPKDGLLPTLDRAALLKHYPISNLEGMAKTVTNELFPNWNLLQR